MSIKINTLSIIELLYAIRKRPAMFLGNEITLTRLYFLLLGFGFHKTKRSVPPFEYFHLWVCKKLGTDGTAVGWLSLLLDASKGDEKKAFERFYELLDEFVAITPHAIYEATLDRENFAFYYATDKGRTRRYVDASTSVMEPVPYCLKMVQFDFSVWVYFYDFSYAIKECQKSFLCKNYDTRDSAKEAINRLFGTLEWNKQKAHNTMRLFEEIVKNTQDIE